MLKSRIQSGKYIGRLLLGALISGTAMLIINPFLFEVGEWLYAILVVVAMLGIPFFEYRYWQREKERRGRFLERTTKFQPYRQVYRAYVRQNVFTFFTALQWLLLNQLHVMQQLA